MKEIVKQAPQLPNLAEGQADPQQLTHNFSPKTLQWVHVNSNFCTHDSRLACTLLNSRSYLKKIKPSSKQANRKNKKISVSKG